MNRKEYLLSCMAEECAEVQKAISKALRFGTEDIYPKRGKLTNAEEIAYEFIDIMAVMEMLEDIGVLDTKILNRMDDIKELKKKKIIKYMKYSRDVGTLQDEGE